VVSSTKAFLMTGLAFQLMSKNLNSELKKKHNFTFDLSRRGVEGSPGAVGRKICDGRPYGEKLVNCMTYVNY
jgi:hypothetical protein